MASKKAQALRLMEAVVKAWLQEEKEARGQKVNMQPIDAVLLDGLFDVERLIKDLANSVGKIHGYYGGMIDAIHQTLQNPHSSSNEVEKQILAIIRSHKGYGGEVRKD